VVLTGLRSERRAEWGQTQGERARVLGGGHTGGKRSAVQQTGRRIRDYTLSGQPADGHVNGAFTLA